ncbi:HEAT repeat domain-containing protein [Streptomyces sp. NPDC090741]|uniref:HEAT repeat domain-containing protein n=1 Tax=Streptomyces sp. NPDC090741 TaxID=3365967 RepID=UPI0037FF5F98
MGTPLAEERVAAFEARHGVRLPRSYRTFLREIGNGGIGPHYGLLPLTRWYVHDIPATTERLGSVFALEPTDSVATDWARLRYLQNNPPYAGTLTVVDRGCLEVTLLVISGPARGRLLDTDLKDLATPPTFHPQPDFLTWYENWLDTLPGGELVPDFRHQRLGGYEELIDTLADSGSACERQAAAYTLGGRHPLTDRARDVLVQALADDPDRRVKMDAARTLTELDSDAAAQVLASALRDPDHWVRRRALVHLLQVTNDETAYGAAARELLQDENPNVRMAATDLLGRAGWSSHGNP